MEGKMTVIHVDGTKTVTEYDKKIPIEDMQAAVGGYIETVPRFDTYDGFPCVAFCNEEGKLDGLSFNEFAQRAWEQQIGVVDDALVGNVAIIQGDAAFMRAL